MYLSARFFHLVNSRVWIGSNVDADSGAGLRLRSAGRWGRPCFGEPVADAAWGEEHSPLCDMFAPYLCFLFPSLIATTTEEDTTSEGSSSTKTEANCVDFGPYQGNICS